jgi:hypothetical protein
MLGTEFRNSTYIDDGTYEGYISVDEDRFYLRLHTKKTGYKLHEISVTFVDDDNWVLVSKSYHGGKVRGQYYRRDLVYDKDLGIPNEVLYNVVDAIRSEAQLIKIIQLVHDVVDVELYNKLDSLVDFIDVGIYLNSTFKSSAISLGPVLNGSIELKHGFKDIDVELDVKLFGKVSGRLLYRFQVIKLPEELSLVSTVFGKDGVSVVNATSVKEKVITDEHILECMGIIKKVECKEALIELITCSGF